MRNAQDTQRLINEKIRLNDINEAIETELEYYLGLNGERSDSAEDDVIRGKIIDLFKKSEQNTCFFYYDLKDLLLNPVKNSPEPYPYQTLKERNFEIDNAKKLGEIFRTLILNSIENIKEPKTKKLKN